MNTPAPVSVIPARRFDTPSLRVQRYWHRHPARAWAIMHAMMQAQPAEPVGEWPRMKGQGRYHTINGKWTQISFKPLFREPPKSPYKHIGCPLCGGDRYTLGWHTDWNDAGTCSRGYWHVSCATALRLMQTPQEFAKYFYDRQNGLCAISGAPLGAIGEFDIDHLIPLYRVYRDFRSLPIDRLINFWGPKNLRAITKNAHKGKNRYEAGERAAGR